VLTTLCVGAALVSVAALVVSSLCLLKVTGALRIGADLLSLKERFSNLDEEVVRSVMEEGGEASVEAVLQTMERLIESDDGTMGAAEALKQARDMHKR
jgi:hypothetical protein